MQDGQFWDVLGGGFFLLKICFQTAAGQCTAPGRL